MHCREADRTGRLHQSPSSPENTSLVEGDRHYAIALADRIFGKCTVL